MRLQRDSIQKSLVLNLPGEADFEASCWLKEALQNALANFDGLVVLNLTSVVSLGSHCIGTMITFASEVTQRGLNFCVVCPDGNVRRQISNTRLDKIMPIHATVDAAIAEQRKAEGLATLPRRSAVTRSTFQSSAGSAAPR